MAKSRGLGSFSLFEGFVGLVIVGIILALMLVLCGGVLGMRLGEYSQGYRDGTVYKLSTKGFFRPTHEGELAVEGFSRGGMTKDGQSGGNVWAFSVDNEDIWKQLNELEPGEKVRLHYVEYWMNGYASTNYQVLGVDKIPE
jgi:hypothetical protein